MEGRCRVRRADHTSHGKRCVISNAKEELLGMIRQRTNTS